MAQWDIDLSDGRTVTVESDHEPNEDEILSSLQTVESQPAPVVQNPFPEIDPRRIELGRAMAAERMEPRPTAWTGFREELGDRIGDVGRGFLRFIPAAMKTAGAIASDNTQMEVDPFSGAIVPKLVQPPAAVPEQNPLYRAGAGTEEFLTETFPPPQEPELSRSVTEGFGQMGSMLVGGGAARALGAGLPAVTATATAMGGVQEFDDAFTRSRQRGDDPDTALAKSLGYASVAAMIENRLGAGRVLRQLMPSAKDAISRLTKRGVSKKILGNFVAGGAEEGAQRVAQNWIVEGTPSMEGVIDEALPGAIVQGITGLPGAAVTSQPQRTQNAIQPESAPIPGNVQQPEVAQESAQKVPAAEDSTQAPKARLTPAVRSEDGEIETASDHGTAQLQHARAGRVAIQTDRPQDFGFVDETGKFLTREEAVPIFEQVYGKKPSDPNRVKSEDLKNNNPVEQAKAASIPQQVGTEIGFEFNPTSQMGGIRTEGMTPEQISQLEAVMPKQWEFTDRRPGSPTQGLTFYVPEGATREQIVQRANEKVAESRGGISSSQEVLSQPSALARENSERFREAMSPEKSAELEADLRKEGWNVSGVSSGGKLFDHFEIYYRAKKISEADTKSEAWRKIMDGEVVAPDGKTAYELFVEKELDSRSKSAEGRPSAVGFLPRMSEITGAGEPSLPPTVADVQQQRATEARESGIAPGEKTTPSQGNWFAGMNPRETSRMMQDRATTFLQGKTDEQAITDIARMAGGDPSVQLDHQAANFAIKDLLVKINRLIQTTENPAYKAEAWQQIDRLAELSRRMGAEDARSLVSRQLAYKQIDWLMPVLTWRNIVQSKWRNALGIEPNQSIDDAIAKLPKEEKDKLLKRLPELNGEKAKKLEELSKRAKTEPQGVKRNKTMEEMVKLIQSDASISKTDLLRDLWYSSVLMRIGTFVNVLAGSYSTGASFAGLAAVDRLARLKPLQAMKIIGQFIGGTIEGTLIADQIARKGAYHLLPDAEQRMVNLLTGKAGARFDNLEELLRRGNPVGVLAYTRRFMAALDYIGALGTRDSQVLYAALTRGDQESLAAVERRFDKALNKRAEQQARDEMGPKASRAEVLSRKREILEEGVSEEIREAALHTARRAAQNAEPRGIPGIIYKGVSKLPFWVRAPTGLAFIRAGMNMVQNAVDYMPGIGALAAARGYAGTLPKTHPLNRMGLGLDIPIEERRMMWVAQAASFGIAATAAAMFLGDEDDKEDGWEISGSWRGLDPKKRSQLMELGERPNSIRFGKNSPWISFKQMPFAPPLAMIGTMRDEERFDAKNWDAESAGNKLVTGWLSGLMYVRDLSALSGIAGIFDANAWSTQENPTKTVDRINRWGAQSIGRAGAGYIPSILKEIDEFADPTLYRPSKDEMFGWWLRNIPYARRTEKPALNNFGEAIQQTRPPIKSWAGFGKDNDLYNTLGELASRGIFLPEPDKQRKIVDDNGEYREMTEDEWYKFIQTRGPILKEGFTPSQLEFLREANDEEKVEWLKDHAQKSTADAVSELWPLTRYDFMRKTK